MNKRRQLIVAAAALLITRPIKAVASFFRTNSHTQVMDEAFFELSDLEKKLKSTGNRYLPFLNVEKLKSGLYVLPAGAEDKQRPHAEDEVYYVISGRSKFVAGDKTTEVMPGSVLYVKAQVEHRFYDIEEELKIMVFFSNMT